MNELMNMGNEIRTISSIEVAAMMGKEHYEILAMIHGKSDRKGIIEILTDIHMYVSDYFIESAYKDGSGKSNKCYECTKMGCDMLANKMTGEKGVLFTARYVKQFNDMENQLKQQQYMITLMEFNKSQEQFIDELKEVVKEQKEQIDEQQEQINYIQSKIGIRRNEVYNYSKQIKDHLMIKLKNEDYENIKRMFLYELKVTKFEDITYSRENIKLLSDICKEYKPSRQKRLFK